MIRALKACRFAGKDYSAGEIVPEAAIDKKAIGALSMLKLISVEADSEVKADVQLQPKSGKRRKPQSAEV